MNDIHSRLKWRLIPAGLILMVLGIIQLIKIWTPESSLIIINGTLSSSDIYVSTIDTRKGEKNKIELIFYLYNTDYKFYLSKNIEQKWTDETYEKMNRQLRIADTVIVGIAPRDIDYYEPEIFTIKTDKTEVLSYSTTRNSAQSEFLILSVLGMIFILVPFIYKFLSR